MPFFMEIIKMPKLQPKENENRLDVKLMDAGDYEVTLETKFTIDIYLKKINNRWIICDGPGKDIRKESVTMRMWNYDEMVDLRKQATMYDQLKRIHMVDNDLLNRLKAQKLLIDWSFAEKNERIYLHRINGVMTDESWDKFKKLSPNIIRYIFEKMNDIYEYNC